MFSPSASQSSQSTRKSQPFPSCLREEKTFFFESHSTVFTGHLNSSSGSVACQLLNWAGNWVSITCPITDVNLKIARCPWKVPVYSWTGQDLQRDGRCSQLLSDNNKAIDFANAGFSATINTFTIFFSSFALGKKLTHQFLFHCFVIRNQQESYGTSVLRK
eukprot:m.205199 g.205199  ORF g.205199 m.205199 type:complete len:161 (-) comp13746_c1_seq5:54-536(-)